MLFNWFSRYLLTGSALWLILGTQFKVAAQSPPNPIFPREPQLPTPRLPTPEPNPLQPPSPAPTPPTSLPELPETIVVERFEFEGNTAFSSKELAAVTQRFIGIPITFAQLLEAEAAITKKYVDAGYVNSGAVVTAEQNFIKNRAVIKIKIVEGSVENIQVTGTRLLNPNYVRSRLALATKRPFNRNRLLEALQLLQLDPVIKSISAELQPGIRPESSVLEVQVKEANTFKPEAFIDNERSPAVGSFRRGVRLRELNLSGLGDALDLSYANTDGSNEYNLNYTVPINAHNGTIGLSVNYTDTKVIESPFNRINIQGTSPSTDLTFRQPIIQKPNREFALGLTAHYQQSQTFLLGEAFPLSPGADAQGNTRIYALRFFQDYVQRNPKEVFALRSQFSIGFDIFNATINNSGPDARFFAWRGEAQYVRLLAPDTFFIFRTDVQLTPDPLVSLEQIGIGGFNSVRGYRQDKLLTDNGIRASAEARIPIFRLQQEQGVLQVAPFIDFGLGWNNPNQPPIQDSNTLIGTGLGLLWQMGDRFSARIDYGIPLISVHSSNKTLQEQGVYFNVRYSP